MYNESIPNLNQYTTDLYYLFLNVKVQDSTSTLKKNIIDQLYLHDLSMTSVGILSFFYCGPCICLYKIDFRLLQNKETKLKQTKPWRTRYSGIENGTTVHIKQKDVDNTEGKH